MLDSGAKQITMRSVDREDKALLRSNLSARSMPGDGREHGDDLLLLSSCPSFGLKALNLLACGEATSKADIILLHKLNLIMNMLNVLQKINPWLILCQS